MFTVVPVEGSIAPGQSQDITVTFQPDHPSVNYSDRLTIELSNKVSWPPYTQRLTPSIHFFTQPDLGLKSHHRPNAVLPMCSHYPNVCVLYSRCSSWYNNLNPVPFLSLRVKCVWWTWRVQRLHITCIYMEETCWKCPLSHSSLHW